MHKFFNKKKYRLPFQIAVFSIILSFVVTLVIPPTKAQAQTVPVSSLGGSNLPIPGAMVNLSSSFSPAMIKGLTIYPDKPLQFNFIVDAGDSGLEGEALRVESEKLIKYFMVSLTVPDDEMWVNLSPYEKNRIIADGLGQTEMGRDLLAQDYILKQLTSSLMYPEDELGAEFWERVYTKAKDLFGTTDIPMNTFNKIWILPEKAKLYVNDANVFVVENHLKVMLEEDYLALEHNRGHDRHGAGKVIDNEGQIMTGVQSEIVREIFIPEIEREVNEGKNFANLRQIFNSLVLAVWYKNNLKESLLSQTYFDKSKTDGIALKDVSVNQKIYDRYVTAFKMGVFNYMKEDYDAATQEIVPRKYFSGGVHAQYDAESVQIVQGQQDAAMSAKFISTTENPHAVQVVFHAAGVNEKSDDAAMTSWKNSLATADLGDVLFEPDHTDHLRWEEAANEEPVKTINVHGLNIKAKFITDRSLKNKGVWGHHYVKDDVLHIVLTGDVRKSKISREMAYQEYWRADLEEKISSSSDSGPKLISNRDIKIEAFIRARFITVDVFSDNRTKLTPFDRFRLRNMSPEELESLLEKNLTAHADIIGQSFGFDAYERVFKYADLIKEEAEKRLVSKTTNTSPKSIWQEFPRTSVSDYAYPLIGALAGVAVTAAFGLFVSRWTPPEPKDILQRARGARVVELQPVYNTEMRYQYIPRVEPLISQSSQRQDQSERKPELVAAQKLRPSRVKADGLLLRRVEASGALSNTYAVALEVVQGEEHLKSDDLFFTGLYSTIGPGGAKEGRLVIDTDVEVDESQPITLHMKLPRSQKGDKVQVNNLFGRVIKNITGLEGKFKLVDGYYLLALEDVDQELTIQYDLLKVAEGVDYPVTLLPDSDYMQREFEAIRTRPELAHIRAQLDNPGNTAEDVMRIMDQVFADHVVYNQYFETSVGTQDTIWGHFADALAANERLRSECDLGVWQSMAAFRYNGIPAFYAGGYLYQGNSHVRAFPRHAVVFARNAQGWQPYETTDRMNLEDPEGYTGSLGNQDNESQDLIAEDEGEQESQPGIFDGVRRTLKKVQLRIYQTFGNESELYAFVADASLPPDLREAALESLIGLKAFPFLTRVVENEDVPDDLRRYAFHALRVPGAYDQLRNIASNLSNFETDIEGLFETVPIQFDTQLQLDFNLARYALHAIPLTPEHAGYFYEIATNEEAPDVVVYEALLALRRIGGIVGHEYLLRIVLDKKNYARKLWTSWSDPIQKAAYLEFPDSFPENVAELAFRSMFFDGDRLGDYLTIAESTEISASLRLDALDEFSKDHRLYSLSRPKPLFQKDRVFDLLTDIITTPADSDDQDERAAQRKLREYAVHLLFELNETDFLGSDTIFPHVTEIFNEADEENRLRSIIWNVNGNLRYHVRFEETLDESFFTNRLALAIIPYLQYQARLIKPYEVDSYASLDDFDKNLDRYLFSDNYSFSYSQSWNGLKGLILLSKLGSSEAHRALQQVSDHYQRIAYPDREIEAEASAAKTYDSFGSKFLEKFEAEEGQERAIIQVDEEKRDQYKAFADVLERIVDQIPYGIEDPFDSAQAIKDADEALLADVGGIDLNPQAMNLDVEGDELEFEVPVNQFDPAQAAPVNGYVPLIINITPITNLPFLLGEVQPKEEPQLSSLY